MKQTFILTILALFIGYQSYAQPTTGKKSYTSLEDYYADFCPPYHQILASMPANFEKIKAEKISSTPFGKWKSKVQLPMCSGATINEREVGSQMEFEFGSSSDSMVASNAFAILKNALIYCHDSAWTHELKSGEDKDMPDLVSRFIMYDPIYQKDNFHLSGSYVYIDWIRSKAGLYTLKLNFYHL